MRNVLRKNDKISSPLGINTARAIWLFFRPQDSLVGNFYLR